MSSFCCQFDSETEAAQSQALSEVHEQYYGDLKAFQHKEVAVS